MKRFVAFICLIAMLSNVAFAAGNVKEIVFDKKIENPDLGLPISEKIIMKNGSLVLEAEDMEYEKCMSVKTDSDASGEKALYVNASGFLWEADMPKAKPKTVISSLEAVSGRSRILSTMPLVSQSPFSSQ